MLSHHHKAIFVHIPKCAGQSIESAFLKDIGLTWETRAPLLLRPNDRDELGPPRLAHLIAADYVRCSYVPQPMFDDYYRFAIVRDPWARAVSLYRHLDLNMPFPEFVLHWLPDQFDQQNSDGSFWFVRSQYDFLFDKGENLMSQVFRFENLADDFAKIAKACTLGTTLPHVNARNTRARTASRSLSLRFRQKFQANKRCSHPNWRDYYDAELSDAIGTLYAADVKAFDYAAPSAAGNTR